MVVLSDVPVGAMSLERFGSVLPPEDYERLLRTMQRGSEAYGGRVLCQSNRPGWRWRFGAVSQSRGRLFRDSRAAIIMVSSWNLLGRESRQCLGRGDRVVRKSYDLKPHLVERQLAEQEFGDPSVP